MRVECGVPSPYRPSAEPARSRADHGRNRPLTSGDDRPDPRMALVTGVRFRGQERIQNPSSVGSNPTEGTRQWLVVASRQPLTVGWPQRPSRGGGARLGVEVLVFGVAAVTDCP